MTLEELQKENQILRTALKNLYDVCMSTSCMDHIMDELNNVGVILGE